MAKLVAAEYLTREERKALMKKNDLRAAGEILWSISLIAGAFALVHYFPNIFTILIALFVLGGQQLACSVLMHDAGHHAVFSHGKVNDFIGQWVGAYPIFHHLLSYRHYHYRHHVHTGLEEDPDLLLTRGYPTSKKSMLRKVFRDLSGITGIKSYIGLISMHLGFIEYNLGKKIVRVSQKDRSWPAFLRLCIEKLGGPLLVNGALFGLFWALGNPLLYALWVGGLLTTFQFSLRIRSISEHSVVEDTTDPLRNTRTTYANWIERLLFAPYHVNYHLEHHMLMAVPSYNLPKMHRLIKERGFYEKGLLEKNYWAVVQLAVGNKKR